MSLKKSSVVKRGNCGHPESQNRGVPPKVPTSETDTCKCLKLLKNGDLHLIDADGMAKDFRGKYSLGDVFQYELHNYAKKNSDKKDSDVETFTKLAKLCYEKESVTHFKNMDRFVGCVYYISSYLLKKEQYEAALFVGNSLKVVDSAISQAGKTGSDISNFLCTLHSSFIGSAMVLTLNVTSVTDPMYKLSQDLARVSLTFLQFIKVERQEIAKKVLRKSKVYLHSLKHYNDDDVVTFYSTLKKVMKTLHPKFTPTEFCTYFLFKIDNLKDVDYTDGENVSGTLTRIAHFLFLFLDSQTPETTKARFNSLMSLFFKSADGVTSDPCDLIKNCIGQCDGTGDEGRRRLLFLLASSVFHHGIQHWWTFIFGDEQRTKVSVPTITRLLVEMLEVTKQFCRSKDLYCSAVKSGLETCFGDLLTGNLHKIQYTVRQCLKNKLPGALSLVQVSQDAFAATMNCLDAMTAAGCCKNQRSCAWKLAVIHQTNLIEDILKWPISEETWTLLKSCSRELLHEIVNSEFELPYDDKRVGILFQRWHQSLLKLKKFQDGLFVCLMYHMARPNAETEIVSMWIQTKSESENEIIQEMTFSDIVKNCEPAIKEFLPKFNRRQVNVKALVLMELRAYSSCPEDTFKEAKTSQSLVSRLWKQAEKLDLNLWETSFAYTCLLLSSGDDADRRLPAKLQEKCNDIIDRLTRWTSKGKAQCRSFMYAGNLRFSLFLRSVRQAETSEGTMEGTDLVLGYLRKVNAENVKFGEDADLNLTCSVVPSSSHLTVDLETKYLDSLTGVVELWRKALAGGTDELPTAVEFESWLDNVKLVAYLFELYGEHHKSLCTWLLFYKIGQMCNDGSAVLLGLSHLMGNCSDVDRSELLKEAEELATKLDAEGKGRDVTVGYRLTIASNHLRNKRPAECLDHLVKARKSLEGMRPTMRRHTLNARMWCLISQLVAYRPSYEVEFGYRPGTDLRVIVFKAFNYAVAAARSHLSKTATQSDYTELVLAMLDANIWAFHFHEIYSQTDFMRLFMDDLYQIVQKLFLPTRTAEILVCLAEVDLICEKISDCQEKVSKLKSILTTLSSEPETCNKFIKSEPDLSPYAPRSRHVQATSPRAISPARFLDKPHDSKQSEDVSPIHYHLVADVKQAKTVRHGSRCDCRVCRNALIQMLTMTTLSLEGEMLTLEGEYGRAGTCYSEALNVLEKLERLVAETGDRLRTDLATSLTPNVGPLCFLTRTVEYYSARLLVKYALYEAVVANAVTDNMRSAMTRLGTLMRTFSHEQKLLMWRFGELKLLAVVLAKGETKFVPKGTPKEYANVLATKTPMVSRKRPPLAVKQSRLKIPGPAGAKPKPLVLSDEKNTAFLGSENIPSERKIFHQPRQLRFRTNEPTTTAKKTVKKAPNARLKDIKPKKLNLD